MKRYAGRVLPRPATRDTGYTFIEIVIVSAIIAILASAILPFTKVAMQRQREIELRRDLRDMRVAIDKFKDASDAGKITPGDLPAEADGYPGSLDQLVEGVAVQNDTTGARLRFLRRIPIDPMTKTADWGKRSSRDNPTAKTWGGQNVWEVYSTSDGRALDGTKYSDW
jgi:general secretion pathway protein G